MTDRDLTTSSSYNPPTLRPATFTENEQYAEARRYGEEYNPESAEPKRRQSEQPSQMEERSSGSTSLKPKLRFESKRRQRSHSYSSTTTESSDDEDRPHWTLRKSVDASRYHHLLRLPHKLSPSNYVTWMTMMEAALETADMFGYCTREIRTSTADSSKVQKRWKKANALVRSILTSNMTEEVIGQIGHIKDASEIWSEAKHLFAGQSLTDWTLLVTNLITTKYHDGEDVAVHIATMRGY